MSDESTTEAKPMMSLADEFRAMWGLLPLDTSKPKAPAKPLDVAAMVRAQRLEHFKRLCPAEFRGKIDRKRLGNPAAWDEAEKWNGSFPGVWLWSHETGEAKSRFLWHKFGDLHVNRAKSVMRVTGLNLAEDYADARQGGKTFKFYDRFGNVEVVMLDDLDKMDLPADGLSLAEKDRAMRNARFLRELFDTFYEEHTPVLVTANEPISWFGDRIGASCERRMREVCREIEF